MKDRDDIDDRDHIRENGTNGIDRKSSYSLAVRNVEVNNPCLGRDLDSPPPAHDDLDTAE